jgi:hypothetical protein
MDESTDEPGDAGLSDLDPEERASVTPEMDAAIRAPGGCGGPAVPGEAIARGGIGPVSTYLRRSARRAGLTVAHTDKKVGAWRATRTT